MMKRIILLITLVLAVMLVKAQEKPNWQGKFEQLGTTLPTPNTYRTASGAPGEAYWQQKADYKIKVSLNEDKQTITGSETITYFNNSPDNLTYLWVQLDQNMRAKTSQTPQVAASSLRSDSIAGKILQQYVLYDVDYDGGFKLTAVKDAKGNDLSYVVNHTMMRINLPEPLKPGTSVSFSIDWWYNINDRMKLGGRGGYEYFPKDDNYLFTIAQWFPRMAVYSDVEGWQNKQFLGRGEFALVFGDYDVEITVPADHIVASTGSLQNAKDVLTDLEQERFEKAQNSEEIIVIVTQDEATRKEKAKSTQKSTWHFKAENVRDFAFASSRKFIWDAQMVDINGKKPLAMSYYPKEGNPLWEKESTKAVAHTLKTYSRMTIDYPYPVAISVHAASIGMEYPMICFNFGRPEEDGSYTDRLKWRTIGVIVHEVGHNFFPMIINSDERQWTWMDEGLNTFVQTVTQKEHYPDMPKRRGEPNTIVNYMKGDPDYIRPIMTNSEQIIQFGNNAYGKPATALTILRETIMGEEEFDYAFKEYATRWAFKHPEPADLFRTMEDASGVDLDWYWKGWFYTIDNVEIELSNVRWFKVSTVSQGVEGQSQSGKIQNANKDEDGNNKDFSNGPENLVITDTPDLYYGEYMNTVDDEAIRKKNAKKNFYELTLKNNGGLVMPVIIEWNYTDGTKEIEMIPAEIWRANENKVTKVFAKDKEVASIVIDPELRTADVNTENNVFPKKESKSRLEEFKNK
ncbi:MAG: M1 family metallopeptidase [Cyclobacteriaceae bacterium]|nr:M1 family metallopeptidase [Cyclobacteriaceae bacterium]